MLFAAGAVAIEAWIANYGKNWVKTAILAPLVVGGMVAAPLALPILPLDAAVAYANFWDVEHVQVEKEPSGKLPQTVCGHDGLAAAGGGRRRRISIVVRRRINRAWRFLAKNYGQAGAIDYFGPS